MKNFTIKTQGTCARQIEFGLENGRLHHIHFQGGCSGNLSAISKLLEGRCPPGRGSAEGKHLWEQIHLLCGPAGPGCGRGVEGRIRRRIFYLCQLEFC